MTAFDREPGVWADATSVLLSFHWFCGNVLKMPVGISNNRCRIIREIPWGCSIQHLLTAVTLQSHGLKTTLVAANDRFECLFYLSFPIAR
jgi:hypothetical protein